MRMLALELAIDDRGEDARVDIAAAQDEADLASAEMRGVGQHRREPRRARAFGKRLLMGEIGHHRALDIALADQAHIVDNCLQMAMVRSVTFLTAMPSASVEPPQRAG